MWQWTEEERRAAHDNGQYVAIRLSLLGERIGGHTLSLAYAQGNLAALKLVHGPPGVEYWIDYFTAEENRALMNGVAL